MRFIDWFAGIGGFRRGMELAGHKCVGFCEWDKFAAASYTSMHLITDEQRERLAKMPLKQRQKEILKNEYRNGEWYAPDIRYVRADDVPDAECWCFGAPCQDFSVAGKRAGLDGDRSSLVREIFRLVREKGEENKPEWLIYENVKGMLSSNRGFDFLAILLEMDELGYDCEWFTFNSKYHGVPQNRERVYTIGHLRAKGERKILPLKGTDGKDSVSIDIIGHREGYRRNTQIFSPSGGVEALDTAAGGGRGHHTAIPMCIAGIDKGNQKFGKQYAQQDRVYDGSQVATSLTSQLSGNVNYYAIPMFGIDYNKGGQERQIANTVTTRNTVNGLTNIKQDGTAVCIPVLTPDRAEKRQNGRRFKDNGEESFTLTGQDRHGVAIKGDISVPVIWYDKYKCYIAIRKLTPRECWRLQSFSDDEFDKAQFVNSDSQLYKQAGNSVTVNVVYDIAKAIGETYEN